MELRGSLLVKDFGSKQQKSSHTLLSTNLEHVFYRWGTLVASKPAYFIIVSLLFTILCGLALVFKYESEHRPDKLWIPSESETRRDIEWLRIHVPVPPRECVAILTSSNVLVPAVLQKALDIHQRVKVMSVDGNRTWKDVCFKLPVTKFKMPFISFRLRRQAIPWSEHFDSSEEDLKDNLSLEDRDSNSLEVNNNPLCAIIRNLKEACWESNPSELWSYEKFHMDKITEKEIISVFNNVTDSPIFGRNVNYTGELGGNLLRNQKGEITSAQSIRLKWIVAVNQSEIEAGLGVTDFSTGETVDETTWAWEKAWTQLMKNISESMPEGMHIYYATGRSWGDITDGLLFDDSLLLGLGFCVMYIYISVMIGGTRLAEQRPLLCISGLACVVFSVIVTFGIGATLSLVNGPVNKLLPFLLLGVGIDDVFVVIQSWNNLEKSNNDLQKGLKNNPLNYNHNELAQKVGSTLRHAGLSITLTSVTDIVAFGMGATTVMPGLRYFCIYAVLGILSVLAFQITFFLACFTLHQQRSMRENEAFALNRGTESNEARCGEKTLESLVEIFYSKVLFTRIGKAIALLLTGVCLAISIYGNSQLKQEFNPMWFLPEDSHLAQFLNQREVLYPGAGSPGIIVFQNVNWSSSLDSFHDFSQKLSNSSAFEKIGIWSEDFNLFTKTKMKGNLLEDTNFENLMADFLYSPTGSQYRGLFKFSQNFECGKNLPNIELVMVPFRFRDFLKTNDQVQVMEELNKIISATRRSMVPNFGNEQVILKMWSPAMVGWETDKVISGEFYKNAGLSLLCVLVTTFLFIGNIRVCILCSVCVTLTLVNVGGLMHFWGLTIDVTTFIGLLVGVGLCVDYSAHIALAFTQCYGPKEKKAQEAVQLIGQAVLNGGVSTFLAISMLAFSKSHAYQSFFKIFTIVIGFGLFHGLITLPVLLSLCGPTSSSTEEQHYSSDVKEREQDEDVPEHLFPL